MKIIDNRLRKLEDRFGTGDGKPRILLVVCHAGSQHDSDWQIDILEKHGLLPTEPVGLVCLAGMPRGLKEWQAESYLRENGASLQGLRSLIRVDSGPAWAGTR
jgi:hypothetical protein